MKTSSLTEVNRERRARRAVILLTELGNGADRIIREGDVVDGELGEIVAKAFRTGRSTAVEMEGRNYFLNVHLPPPRLVVIGGVHISQALAPMALIAGYPVEIIDPRDAFASKERFHDVPFSAEWPEEALKMAPLDPYCALAALTHDPKIDDFPIKAALDAGCFYIGALGSRKTHARRVDRLLAMGLRQDQIDRIDAPIGVDIASVSPAEIAVSILAQVIAAFRRRGLGVGEIAA